MSVRAGDCITLTEGQYQALLVSAHKGKFYLSSSEEETPAVIAPPVESVAPSIHEEIVPPAPFVAPATQEQEFEAISAEANKQMNDSVKPENPIFSKKKKPPSKDTVGTPPVESVTEDAAT